MNNFEKCSRLITIFLCICLLFFTHNILFLAIGFVVIDIVSYIVTTFIVYQCVMTGKFNMDESCIKDEDLKDKIKVWLIKKEKKEEEEAEKQKQEQNDLLNIAHESFDDDIGLLKKSNEKLLHILSNSSLEFDKKEFKKILKEIEKYGELHPYRLNRLLNKYALYSNELVELLSLYEKSDKEHESETIDLINEFKTYISSSLNKLKSDENIEMEVSLNILLKELQKENTK